LYNCTESYAWHTLQWLSYTVLDSEQPSLLCCRYSKTQAKGLQWHERVKNEADSLACRRRHDAGRSGKAAWPPDWGPGDASRFAEFPELPKSRTQLGPPRKGPIVMEGIDKPPIARKSVAGLDSNIGSPSTKMSLEDIQNISSADLDDMVFQQQPYKRAAGSQKQ